MKNNFDINTIIQSGNEFITGIYKQLSLLGLMVDDFKPDHLCFRVASTDDYSYYKNELLAHATLLSEAKINGRPISTFLLKNEFSYKNKMIKILELPAPKPGSPYKTGFEHVEFVISDSFTVFQSKYPHLSLTRSGPKNFNAELVLKTPVGQVKFHHVSLDRVIEIEDSKIEDIIFDFDGTLIESREKIHEINRKVFSKALNRDVTLDEAKEKFHSTFEKLFETFKITEPNLKKQTISDWESESKKVDYYLLSGIYPLLLNLKELGYRLHLWTARDEESARFTLDQHQLTTFFKTFSFSTVTSSKPSAKNLTFDWQNAPSGSVALVGDTANDVVAAKNINAIAVGAAWELEDHEQALRKARVEVCFSNPADFQKWLSDRYT